MTSSSTPWAPGQDELLGALGESSGLWYLTEHLQDAIVAFELVNGEPVVRYVNEAFVETFGYERTVVLDEPLNTYIVPEWLKSEASALDERTENGEVNYQRVRRQTATGLREFLYRGIPYADSEQIDGVAIYTDLTAIVRRERQLKVLNRLLRHNLRNELTVINGGVEHLLAEVEREDEAVTTLQSSLVVAVENLLSLTNEASHINRILDADSPDPHEFEVVPLLEESVAEFRERYPAATIEVVIPDSMTLLATSELQTAVESLLENAIEHNPAANPRVRLTLEPVGDEQWADLTVCDDGPVIPPSEQAVVTGTAEITPHRHGSGLGLWLVRWTVDKFGGSLAFEESDLGGNRVRLRLRRPGQC